MGLFTIAEKCEEGKQVIVRDSDILRHRTPLHVSLLRTPQRTNEVNIDRSKINL